MKKALIGIIVFGGIISVIGIKFLSSYDLVLEYEDEDFADKLSDSKLAEEYFL